MPKIPWNSLACANTSLDSLNILALPSCHALIDSLIFFVTWEPNQVIEKIVLCLAQSLPLFETAFSIPLSQ